MRCGALRCCAQIAGQLTFGVLADYLGRRRGFIATLTLLIVGASLSAAAHDVGALTLFTVLALCRFILGVGVGGEYPLSATVSSEASADSAGRGRRVSLVFSMQGVGLLAAPLVVLVLLVISGPGQYETVWRVSLALGAVPGLIMIYFRFKMKETAAFSAARNTSDSALDDERRTRSAAWIAHRWDLLATAGNWFIFDVVFYANSLFSSHLTSGYILKPKDANDQSAVHQYLIDVASSTLYLALCALPGYYGAVLVIDRWGRRKLQLFGQPTSATKTSAGSELTATVHLLTIPLAVSRARCCCTVQLVALVRCCVIQVTAAWL